VDEEPRAIRTIHRDTHATSMTVIAWLHPAAAAAAVAAVVGDTTS